MSVRRAALLFAAAGYVMISAAAQTENLLLNGGFEELSACPTSKLQSYLANPWFSILEAGTVYAGCSSDPKIAPPTGTCCISGSRGYQFPYEGANHAGFSNWNTFPLQDVEYILCPLNRELKAGEQIYVSGFFAPDEGAHSYVFTVPFTNAVGIGFLRDTVGLTWENAAERTLVAAQLAKPLVDTASWTPLSGCYTAIGGERYLILGNFLKEADVIKVFSSYVEIFQRTFIFVDNIKVLSYDPYPDTVVVCREETSIEFATELLDLQIVATPCEPSLTTLCLENSFRQVVTAASSACTLTDTTWVQLLPNDGTTLDSTLSICGGDEIILTSPFPGEIVWENGSVEAPHRVTTAGIYSATVTNNCGTFQIDYAVEEVDCACALQAPNAFSPNGDGVNDVLEFYNTCPSPLSNFVLQVFDRWGGLLAELHDEKLPPIWDGTASGVGVNVGTYVVVLRYSVGAEDESFESKIFSAPVQLMR